MRRPAGRGERPCLAPRRVTDDMGEVDVHRGAGFWPVLEAGGSGAEEGVALASGGPSHAARSGGTKGAGAQTARVSFGCDGQSAMAVLCRAGVAPDGR